MNNNLQDQFGNIDIYLFDQLLKGRYNDCKKVIDVGCGNGRNIIYFLKQQIDVFGIDMDPKAIQAVKELSTELAPDNNVNNFIVAKAEELPFEDSFFDLAICSAVLHFATNEEHFNEMVRSIWRILRPGGFLFARLASDIGIETLVKPLGDRRFYLPDGSERFLVNEEMLISFSKGLDAQHYEPIKTTNVQNLRCMTTWCIKKAL